MLLNLVHTNMEEDRKLHKLELSRLKKVLRKGLMLEQKRGQKEVKCLSRRGRRGRKDK